MNNEPQNSYNYYSDQINRIDVESEYGPKIQLSSGEGDRTKWLNINEISAPLLIEYLKQFCK